MVRRVPAFKHCPSQILSLICMALQPQIYLPADTVRGPAPPAPASLNAASNPLTRARVRARPRPA